MRGLALINAGVRFRAVGFYDGVISPAEDDICDMAEGDFGEKGMKEIDGFINDLHGIERLKKNYYAPAANICGMVSGYTGEGSKTVLPGEAFAKMDFRLVPG